MVFAVFFWCMFDFNLGHFDHFVQVKNFMFLPFVAAPPFLSEIQDSVIFFGIHGGSTLNLDRASLDSTKKF
jgi:hypothetical protein